MFGQSWLASMITICCSLTERIYDIFVIFFSQISKQVHKVIISKDFIWSSYNIHFVSLHHKYHHHHHLSIILCNIKLKVSTSPKQPISSRVQVLYHWIWRCLTLDTLTSVSIFSILFFVCFLWYWKREFIWRSMLLRLVIISFILMSLVNDSAVLLQAFQGMGQVRQVQKWQLALKEKSADFKSPDLGSSAYALINYNHR